VTPARQKIVRGGVYGGLAVGRGLGGPGERARLSYGCSGPHRYQGAAKPRSCAAPWFTWPTKSVATRAAEGSQVAGRDLGLAVSRGEAFGDLDTHLENAANADTEVQAVHQLARDELAYDVAAAVTPRLDHHVMRRKNWRVQDFHDQRPYVQRWAFGLCASRIEP